MGGDKLLIRGPKIQTHYLKQKMGTEPSSFFFLLSKRGLNKSYNPSMLVLIWSKNFVVTMLSSFISYTTAQLRILFFQFSVGPFITFEATKLVSECMFKIKIRDLSSATRNPSRENEKRPQSSKPRPDTYCRAGGEHLGAMLKMRQIAIHWE
jgi:hypothetical protein